MATLCPAWCAAQELDADLAVPDDAQLPDPADEVGPSSPAERASGEELRRRYYQTVKQAILEFDAQHFAEARSLFLIAHELWPSARTFRTLGMTAFELRLYPRARIELQAALGDDRRPLSNEQREQVDALLKLTLAFVGCYEISLSPPDALLFVDTGRVQLAADHMLTLAVGTHELTVRAEGYRELRRQILVQGRENERLALSLEPDPPLPGAPSTGVVPAADAPRVPSTDPAGSGGRYRALRTSAWSTTALAGVGLVTAAVLGGLAIRQKRTLERACIMNECRQPYFDDLDRLDRLANASTASVAIGAAAATAATILWIATYRAAQRTNLQSGFSLRSLQLGGHF